MPGDGGTHRVTLPAPWQEAPACAEAYSKGFNSVTEGAGNRPFFLFVVARTTFVKMPRDESMRILNMLNLSKAIKMGKIKEFVAQEEARGIGPVERRELDETIERLATKSTGRTSRSSSDDGSTGT